LPTCTRLLVFESYLNIGPTSRKLATTRIAAETSAGEAEATAARQIESAIPPHHRRDLRAAHWSHSRVAAGRGGSFLQCNGSTTATTRRHSAWQLFDLRLASHRYVGSIRPNSATPLRRPRRQASQPRFCLDNYRKKAARVTQTGDGFDPKPISRLILP
jgi:hypothetical protein